MPEPIFAVAGDTTVMGEITFERELVDCEQCGGAGMIERTERVPVVQNGRLIGTVPPSFDPLKIKSTSIWYDPRPGDFVPDRDVWIAARTLGPSDLEAVPGFVWHRQE